MLQIGKVKLKTPVMLAPLSGISDYPFRIITRSFGCPLAFLQMISAKALVYGSPRTFKMISISTVDKPIAAQIVGSEPEIMRDAALMLEEAGVDFIDLNAACPVPKIIMKNAGAALLKDTDLLKKILKTIVKNISIPLTIKIRSGWDKEHLNAVHIARVCEEMGVKAVFIHGRYKKQGYSGAVSYEIIASVKKAINIPLIASGDIWNGESARKMFELTNCDGITVARGAIGNPWIFSEINHVLGYKKNFHKPSLSERKQILLKHCTISAEFYGEKLAMRKMQYLIRAYLKGITEIRRISEKIRQGSTIKELNKILDKWIPD